MPPFVRPSRRAALATALALPAAWAGERIEIGAEDDWYPYGGVIQGEAYATGEPQETMRKFFAERAARRAAKGKA